MSRDQGQLSTKSDVWSFGVTLWEVLTYARWRPLAALADRQVLANLERISNSSSSSSLDGSPPPPSVDDVTDDDDDNDEDGNHADRVIGSSSGEPIVLPGRPAGCPRETYDLMRECWRRDANRRPTFRETHMFLQRLNVGYTPPPPPRTTASLTDTGFVNGCGGAELGARPGDLAGHRQPASVGETMGGNHRGNMGTAGYQRTGSRYRGPQE